MITVTTNIPPPILNLCNVNLLTAPIPKFRDDEEDVKDILDYLIAKKWYKLEKCPAKKRQCEQLKNEILEMYGRIKEKKKNGTAEKDNKTEGFGYYFSASKGYCWEILYRLKYKARMYKYEQWNDHEI